MMNPAKGGLAFVSGLLLCFLGFLAQGQTFLYFRVDSVKTFPKTTVEVKLRVTTRITLMTAQGSLSYDTTLLEFDEVVNNGKFNISPSNFNLQNNGLLSFSWDDASLRGLLLEPNDSLFTLKFKVLGKAGTKALIQFEQAPVRWECTNQNYRPLSLFYRRGSVTVVERPVVKTNIEIRTGFSPNGDGINDTWEIFEGYSQFPNMLVQVFNKEGDEVYKSEGPYSPWNGLSKIVSVAEGTYYFKLFLNRADEVFYKGYLVVGR
jgi:gliding motility-associated-like protein